MTISCTGSLLYSVHSKPQVDKNASTCFDPQQGTCSMCGTVSNFQYSVDTTLPRFGCCKHAPSLLVSVEVAFLLHWLSWPLIHSVPKWLHITHASDSLGTGLATAGWLSLGAVSCMCFQGLPRHAVVCGAAAQSWPFSYCSIATYNSIHMSTVTVM